MISKGMLLTAAGCLGAIAILGQTPAAPQTGPGVQALQDSKYPDFIASKCKTPPPPRGGGAGRGAGSGSGAGRGSAAAGPPEHRAYEVKEIPGVIAARQQWFEPIALRRSIEAATKVEGVKPATKPAAN